MTTVTRAEFARLLGVNRSTVTRWVDKGQVVADGAGIDVEASRQRLAETGGARPDVADRHAAARSAVPSGVLPGAASNSPASPPSAQQAEDRVGNSYQAARAVKEKYNALQSKLEYERQSGNLIPKEDVDAALKALGASVRAKLDVLPDQLAPLLAPVADLDEVHAILAEHCRGLLAAVADELGRAAASGVGG